MNISLITSSGMVKGGLSNMRKLERFKENLARYRREREVAANRKVYVAPPEPIELPSDTLVQHYIQPLMEYVEENIMGASMRSRAEIQALLEYKLFETQRELRLHRVIRSSEAGKFPPSVELTCSGYDIKLGACLVCQIS